jgi:hypothetical protein
MLLDLGMMFGRDVLPWIVAQAPEIAATLVEWAVAFAAWVGDEGWPRLRDALGEMAGLLWDWLAERATAIAADGSVGRAIVDGIELGIQNAWDGFLDWIDSTFGGLIRTVSGIFGVASPSTVFAEIGGSLIDGLWEGMTGAWGGVIDWITERAGGLLNPFDSMGDQLWDMGSWLLRSMRSGAEMAWVEMIEWISDEADNLTDPFDGMGDRLSDMAGDAISGFRHGLKTAWDDMMGWVGGLPDTMINNMKSAFGIASPSKKAAERLGLPFGEGIAEGIKASRKALLEALNVVEEVLLGPPAEQATNVEAPPPPPPGSTGAVYNSYDQRSYTLNSTPMPGHDVASEFELMQSLA